MTQQEQYYWQQMQRQNTLKAYYAQFGQTGHFGFGGDEQPPQVEQFTLVATAGVGGTLDRSVNGTYPKGEVVSITAVPSEGYEFLGWSNGSTDLTTTVTMTQDISIEATFAAQEVEDPVEDPTEEP